MKKYDLNSNHKFINFKTFNNELENTIAIMTRKINIKIVDELIISLEDRIDNENNNEIYHNNDEVEWVLDNEKINSDESEEFSEESLIDEKEQRKILWQFIIRI